MTGIETLLGGGPRGLTPLRLSCTPAPMPERNFPAWAESIRTTYLRGESSVFLLHGNVFDVIEHNGELLPLMDFLSDGLLAKKEVIVQYNPSTGVKFRKREQRVANLEDLIGLTDNDKVLAGLEKMLRTTDGVALILDYAEMVAPRGDSSFLTDADRRSIITLHRWSLERAFENADNVVVMVAEQLPMLAEKLVSNPRITAVEVPLPDDDDRARLVRRLEPDASSHDVEKLAAHSAGLKVVQIRGILLPGEDSREDELEREQAILRQLPSPTSKEAKTKARKLAHMTSGWTPKEAGEYLRQVHELDIDLDGGGRYDEVLALLAQRKREILEKECFGLIEFVEPAHDFSVVGGMDTVKQELMQVAANIKEGALRRVPMGLLFVGPMGTGKTFVAEAFARSSGLTAIKLKNFRSKWVGATEGNLEKILSVVKAIGNVLVIIDEGDRAFGSGGASSESDGGTSSRVVARIKEFMSDTSNRGRVLFVLMTNRPDKMDIDIKRAGRLDKKIPFFYASEPEDVEPVLTAQLRRHRVAHDLEFPRDSERSSARLVGYSNADIEAVVLAANDAAEAAGERVTPERFSRAVDDYLPSRDASMLEYMELLAVFESSSRSMLPKRFRDIGLDELQSRLRALRAVIQ